MTSTAKTPWLKSRGSLPAALRYFEGSMAEKVKLTAEAHPDLTAYFFMGKKTTYSEMLQKILRCAHALQSIGIKPGDSVTLALPNCPQAVCMFYAVNLVGGLANMVHPLSGESELAFYLQTSGSNTVVTLDQFYEKLCRVRKSTPFGRLIVTSVKDEMPVAVKIGYRLTQKRHTVKISDNDGVITWKRFLDSGVSHNEPFPVVKSEDAAVILYSGGTTGATKGIVLTNRNFNALSQQIIAANPMFSIGDRMLAAMPVFHGFGLGVCIHSMLSSGGVCVLVPRFTAKSYAKLITKKRCQFIAGVPTLYEALLRLPNMKNADFSCLKGVFSGGDSLSVELRKKLDAFLKAHGATISVREGYGTTETVTACCLTPPHRNKEGSIGIPLPDVYMKIVKPETEEELPYGQEGEIVISGPTVMKEYLHHPEETAKTLRTHQDGLTWVYTGDLGVMDEEGFVMFRGRLKRMIVTSGYNVYPAQLENLLDACDAVHMSCVIGVPDALRVQKVKAFVMLKPGYKKTRKPNRSFWHTAAGTLQPTRFRASWNLQTSFQRPW